MDLNPIKLLQLKSKWADFQAAHPKFMPFMSVASTRMEPGSVFAISVTSPDGKVLETNLKLSEADVELLKEVAGITQSMTNR